MKYWQLASSLTFLFLLFSTLYFKYYVANLRQKVHRQEKICRTLQERCELLRLEWIFLTSPQKMDRLTKHFPGLSPLKPRQIQGGLP